VALFPGHKGRGRERRAADCIGRGQGQLVAQLLDRDFHAYVEHLGLEAA
jgi:hypothetical protein